MSTTTARPPTRSTINAGPSTPSSVITSPEKPSTRYTGSTQTSSTDNSSPNGYSKCHSYSWKRNHALYRFFYSGPTGHFWSRKRNHALYQFFYFNFRYYQSGDIADPNDTYYYNRKSNSR
ncbi:hypothetical protein BV898_05281 [Hypsibius exemplaris]|uniref:Uncharacterized protein n=1 Tax=Hypsibius exemplaris TaxID=2072580 RepID=A0A1W0WZV6_HYPEX|nr:hypothetical protein BV898_05281 [Hypsibius exemplaris]